MTSIVQPGRFAQGPEEKQGFCGRFTGFITFSNILPLPYRRAATRWEIVAQVVFMCAAQKMQ